MNSSCFKRYLAWLLILFSIMLISLNIYGLTQSIRKPGLGVLDHQNLRFIPEEVWSYEKSLEEISQLNEIKDAKSLAYSANAIVNKSLVHIDWNRVNEEEYRQLVPVWENYFLYIIGKFSGLPQFERYHYSNYKRNIKRGIGVCGDASTILSSILDKHKIENSIISFKKHVIVEFEDELGVKRLLDPDFGVVLESNLQDIKNNLQIVEAAYQNAGYTKRDVTNLREILQDTYSIFDDTYHFMTMRYIFEELSYILKWLLPILMLVVALIFLRKQNTNTVK